MVNLGWPFVAIEVYPGGIGIRSFLAPPVAIRSEELRNIEWQQRGNRVEIAHSSPDITSPIPSCDTRWMGVGARLTDLAQDLKLS
jgi:hypothetical protein